MRSTVYPPREDTYLLKEKVEQMNLKGSKVLELGCGNGAITKALEEAGTELTAVDINRNAVETTKEKLEQPEKHTLKYSDLFENIGSQEFDYIIFNPPYLGGDTGIGDEEKWYVGDENILNRFFEEVDCYLSEKGEAFLVLSDQTPELEKLMSEKSLEIEAENKVWFEKLYVVRYK